MRDIDTLRMILAGHKAPRKPRGKSIKEGAACMVWGHKGTVAGKHPTRRNWWNVSVTHANGVTEIVGFDRSQIIIQ